MRYETIAATVLLALAADGCARVVKRGPPQGHTAAGTTQAPQPDAGLPTGAQCLESAPAEMEPDDTACPLATDAPAADWPPSGLCFDEGEACPGVDDHVALLTFDDGPSDWTHSFLDILADEGVHATFFVNAHTPPQRTLDDSYVDTNGTSVAYRDLLARELSEGHVLGNHTRDHLDLSMLDAAGIHEQLQTNELLISRALMRAGHKAVPLTLVRPPFGLPWFDADAPLDDPARKRATAAREIARYGINVLWNLSSTDAQEWAQGEAASLRELTKANAAADQPALSFEDKVDRIRTSVLDHPLVKQGRGIVVLMHDTHNATRDALRAIIGGLRERGYAFRTVEEQLMQTYGRASYELTPGPDFDARCAERPAASCAAAEGPPVCGRLWRAFEAFGGEDRLGAPLSAADQGAPLSQRFEHGTLELHPELDEPCHAILRAKP